MTTPKRQSNTQLADLNAQLYSQNEQIKNIQRIANDTQGITDGVQAELFRQKGIIGEGISKV